VPVRDQGHCFAGAAFSRSFFRPPFLAPGSTLALPLMGMGNRSFARFVRRKG